MQIYHGSFVYSETQEKLAVYSGSYLAVEDGIIQGLYPVLPERFAGAPVEDLGTGVMIPAFSDLHVHAPQYPQRGLAMDALLYDWLHQYTFPLEAKYKDLSFAKQVYDAFAADLIASGTMHACIFGTIHNEATLYLMQILEEAGLRCFVGKVNMDMASPDYLCEETEESLMKTERFLEQGSQFRFAKPILTPRFVPTCTRELLSGLGALGKKYQIGVQTHLVESRWEAAEAIRMFPDCSCDTQIYEKAGLLGNGPVIGAHFIYPSEDDIRILKDCGGYAVHCPDATVNVIAGIMRSADLLGRGIRIGLGSDIAGGHCVGVYSQVSAAVQLSKLKWLYEGEKEEENNRPLSFAEAFYLATKEGGTVFGPVGSLEQGYQLDALVLDDLSDPGIPLSPEQVVERFCYTGQNRHIKARYLRGKRL